MADADSEHPLDPLALDRAIASTAERARRWKRSLRRAESLDEDPYESQRWVSQKRTFERVTELPADDPLRTPLRRWLHRLTEERVNRLVLCNAVAAYRLAPRSGDGAESEPMPLNALLYRALSDAPRRETSLRQFTEHASDLSLIVARWWERRQEIAVRLGLASPNELELPGVDCVENARTWLADTEALFEPPEDGTLSGFVAAAMGTDAPEGWPSHINATTLQDWFRSTQLLNGLHIDAGTWPAPLGASSYLRALRRLGAAWVDATAPGHQPFCVAHDPFGLRQRTNGALFATLPMNPAFATRALGIGKAKLADHLRVVRRVALLDSRLAALRVLLRAPALDGRRALSERHEELSASAFGTVLPPSLAGVIPRLAADDPQRFAGMLLGAALHRALTEQHDEDWYRNPRAIEELRDTAQLSPVPTTTAEDLEAGAATLVAMLSGSL